MGSRVELPENFINELKKHMGDDKFSGLMAICWKEAELPLPRCATIWVALGFRLCDREQWQQEWPL